MVAVHVTDERGTLVTVGGSDLTGRSVVGWTGRFRAQGCTGEPLPPGEYQAAPMTWSMAWAAITDPADRGGLALGTTEEWLVGEPATVTLSGTSGG